MTGRGSGAGWCASSPSGPLARRVLRPDRLGPAVGLRPRDDHRGARRRRGHRLGAAILKVPFAFAIGVLASSSPSSRSSVRCCRSRGGHPRAGLPGLRGGPLIMLAVVTAAARVARPPAAPARPCRQHPSARRHPRHRRRPQIAGIVGALATVPFAAVLNAVGKHLPGESPRRSLHEEPGGTPRKGRRPPRLTLWLLRGGAPREERMVVEPRRPRRRTPAYRRRPPGCCPPCTAARPSPSSRTSAWAPAPGPRPGQVARTLYGARSVASTSNTMSYAAEIAAAGYRGLDGPAPEVAMSVAAAAAGVAAAAACSRGGRGGGHRAALRLADDLCRRDSRGSDAGLRWSGSAASCKRGVTPARSGLRSQP